MRSPRSTIPRAAPADSDRPAGDPAAAACASGRAGAVDRQPRIGRTTGHTGNGAPGDDRLGYARTAHLSRAADPDAADDPLRRRRGPPVRLPPPAGPRRPPPPPP